MPFKGRSSEESESSQDRSASAIIRVAGRPFHIKVVACHNDSDYYCQFHEKHEVLGRVVGFHNKNFARNNREDVYGWFKEMTEKHIPQDDSGAQVLNKVVRQLEDEFEQVEQE